MISCSHIFRPSYKESQLILIPIPWEVTASYGAGASEGPQAIVRASSQLDYFDFEFGDVREKGLYWDGPQKEIKSKSQKYKGLAQKVICEFDKMGVVESTDILDLVNQASEELNHWLYHKTLNAFRDEKRIGIVGGDHSSPLGAIKAHCERFPHLGVLHVDAHGDLREAYQGFRHSHASIMRNVMELQQAPATLVQVGVRDYCEEEFNYINRKENIRCFFDREIKAQLFSGTHWQEICQAIISELPDEVYVSFDIDGLSQEFGPHTGTPVPGGLSYDQAIYLLSQLRKSHKKVVGFDLCEVAPGDYSEWDGNVGVRLLYQLCGLTLSELSSRL